MNNSFYRYNYLPKLSNDISQLKRTSQNNKFSLKDFKCNTCKSLNDVEYFLCNFSTFLKYMKLYNLLK